MTDNQLNSQQLVDARANEKNTEQNIKVANVSNEQNIKNQNIETQDNKISNTDSQHSEQKTVSNDPVSTTSHSKTINEDRVATDKKMMDSAKANSDSKNDDRLSRTLVKTMPLQALKVENKGVQNDTSNTTTNNKPVIKAPEPEIKKINISIAGANYAIFCPADEEDELREAEKFINDFTTNIKKDAPKLNQENLLVLSCLNLYEKINNHKKLTTERQQKDEENENLLEKIMREANSVL